MLTSPEAALPLCLLSSLCWASPSWTLRPSYPENPPEASFLKTLPTSDPIGILEAVSHPELLFIPAKYADLSDVFEEKGTHWLHSPGAWDLVTSRLSVFPVWTQMSCTLGVPSKKLIMWIYLSVYLIMSAPSMFVKKCGELHLCNDYWALNKITVRDLHL